MKMGKPLSTEELRRLFNKPAPPKKILLKGIKAKAGETKEEALARIVADVMAAALGPVVQKIIEEVHTQPEAPQQAAGHHHLGWSDMFNKPQNFNGSSRIF